MLNAYKPPKPTDVAHTLDTMCGSKPSFSANYVIKDEKDNDC